MSAAGEKILRSVRSARAALQSGRPLRVHHGRAVATTWNYRAIRHPDGSLAVHEVYYDDDGRPWGATKDPVSFTVNADETLDDLARALEIALAEVRQRPVLEWADSTEPEDDA